MNVPVVTLDSEVGDNQSILLLKTDTQGFEVDVLAGAKLLLQQKVPRFLLVELSHYLLTSAGTSPLQLMELIATFGYVCAHLAFHGPTPGGKSKFGLLPVLPEFERVMSFAELASLLKTFPPHGRPAWTDLLCW